MINTYWYSCFARHLGEASAGTSVWWLPYLSPFYGWDCRDSDMQRNLPNARQLVSWVSLLASSQPFYPRWLIEANQHMALSWGMNVSRPGTGACPTLAQLDWRETLPFHSWGFCLSCLGEPALEESEVLSSKQRRRESSRVLFLFKRERW